MKHMNKLIGSAVIAGAVATFGIGTAHAGVACLQSPAVCAALLDYLLSSTGNDVGDVYTALKNRYKTSACPYGSSETGVYTIYAHSHELDSTNIVAYASTNVSCFACVAATQYSEKMDGYAGVCQPSTTLGWTFASRDCGFEFNQTLARVTFDVNWCAENRGETLATVSNPGGTMSACSSGHGCLQ